MNVQNKFRKKFTYELNSGLIKSFQMSIAMFVRCIEYVFNGSNLNKTRLMHRDETCLYDQNIV
jgi:hypothetical protein